MSKRAKTILKWTAAGFLLPTVLVLGIKLAAQECRQETGVFRELFTDDGRKDTAATSTANWPPSPIELPRLGANFAMTQPGGLGAHIYVCDAADFNNDGYPDLVGLDITRQVAGQTNPYSRLVLIYNVPSGESRSFTIDTVNIIDDINTYTGPASITVGDYNGDGLWDFFFMKNSADQFGYTNFMAVMYINVGTAEVPAFRPYNVDPNLNFTARFMAANIYINWAANHLFSVDIDKDGDTDLLAVSQDRIFLIRTPNPLNFNLAAFDIGELNYDARTGFATGRGGSAVVAADFDRDGDIDVVAGTVNNYAYLVYYENDGTGFFTRKEIAIPNPVCTGTVGLVARDVDNDGWVDIFGATDRWNAGNEAHMWLFRNDHLQTRTELDGEGNEVTITELAWTFRCLNACQHIIPPSYDVDLVTPLDYDADGDIDIILADANHSGDYYLVVNLLADVFQTWGNAQSLNVVEGTLSSSQHAITQIRLARIQQGWRGQSSDGLVVRLYFTNNGGARPEDWILYATWTGTDISTKTDLPWLEFKTFGANLKWKIEMEAQPDPAEEFPGVQVSFDTPRVFALELEYIYVFRSEYSRSSAAATITTRTGERRKLVIGSSFIFPGWEGQLRAYDVTEMSFTGGTYSALNTITSSDLGSATGRTLASGAEILWDAGILLRDRQASDRAIYAAIRADRNPANPLQRVDFVVANAPLLSDFLQDFNNNPAGLIAWVRGTERDWKLGDINHSTPVIVGPPDGEPTQMGTGYAEFKANYAERPKVIYVGANDGMLHCFDLQTGNELWGFIPYNLLLKLKNLWPVDPATNRRYLGHDFYVDGSPSVADVQIDGDWRTVLVCGQGPGKGSTIAGGANYYFALDVTDPLDPQPLWEFTHTYRIGGTTYYTTGETWSVPAIGRVNHDGTERWVAFMGSGYGNMGQSVTGSRFYIVRLDTGEYIKTFSVNNVNTANFTGAKRDYRYTDVPNAIVSSPTAVDADRNGYIDHVYYADLDGRVYRLDVTSSGSNQWNQTAIYTDYLNYPIITKPAVWLDPFSATTSPRVYIGTGGDDRAPNDRDYSFVGLIDSGGNDADVEWFMGNATALNLTADIDKRTGQLGTGYKVWADPVISDFIIYFSTLLGSIESVNPCADLSGEPGRLYARQLRSLYSGISVGGTSLRSSGGVPPEYLTMVSKARRAVTTGEVQRTDGVNKREVYIQEYNSTIEMLANPIGSMLQIKSWREIYRIIR